MLAVLNHPNIAAIYGFEDSGSTHALVVELVEGPTLADRIAKGALPLDEALPIAKQIAEALESNPWDVHSIETVQNHGQWVRRLHRKLDGVLLCRNHRALRRNHLPAPISKPENVRKPENPRVTIVVEYESVYGEHYSLKSSAIGTPLAA